jgi:very-short-patch-repair endonuclease
VKAIGGTEALARSRDLRRSATEAERILWRELRNRRLEGAKFRRQVWVGPFVADFLCVEAKLVIEADGSQHGENREYDVGRDAYLRNEGYLVIRVWNNEVTANLPGVLETIRCALLERVPSPSHSAAPSGPLPLPQGEEMK